MKSNQEHKLNAKVETYQAKKRRLSKEVYDILKAHNYLTFDELKKTDCGYKTTLEINFVAVNEAIEFISKFESLKDLSISYDNFCFVGKRIFFTIRPLQNR